jgi:hypothetical protein
MVKQIKAYRVLHLIIRKSNESGEKERAAYLKIINKFEDHSF